MKALLVLLSGIAMTASAVTGDFTELCRGIAPENNVRIPVSAKQEGGITEQQFNEILDKVYASYSPEYTKRGATFKIERKWDDPTANAYAQQLGNVWQISMFGGLARHAAMTVDGFALVACHEIGHHLGGAPKGVQIFWPSKMSNEGQSDYFGNLKCMRHVFQNDDNAMVMSQMNVDSLARTECEATYTSQADQLLCMRAAMAGKVLGNVLADLGDKPMNLEFNTPDTTVVARTNNSHPDAQCRLDTYFNAVRCPVAWDSELSETDYKPGTCDQQAFNTGSRPKCWFKAK